MTEVIAQRRKYARVHCG